MGNLDIKSLYSTPFIMQLPLENAKETEKMPNNQLAEALSGLDKKTDNPITVNATIDLQNRNTKTDKSKNDKFDLSECLKNLGKGLISPLIVIVKHPFISIGLIAATMLTCAFIPILGIILACGFGALSALEIGKGTYNAIQNYKKGYFDESEKNFNDIGQGIVGLALAFTGLKQSAKVAKEAKVMSNLNVKNLTIAQRKEIANEINANTKLNALKETLSLFTTKAGIKATVKEFTPTMIRKRFFDALPRSITFKKTAEYKRRMKLSNEEIKETVRKEFQKICDEIGIQEKERPHLFFGSSNKRLGGAYDRFSHTIEFNIDAYRNGLQEMEDVLMHEAIHCKQALLRAGIPQERVNSIIKEVLINKIQNGENEKILLNSTNCKSTKASMLTPPKLSSSLKKDFIEFAQKYLHTDNLNVDINELKLLLKKHPEFIKNYNSEEIALNKLIEYATSHSFRYHYFQDNNIYQSKIISLFDCDTKLPIKLRVQEITTEQELSMAEQSLRENINLIEGNVLQKITKSAPKQYMFCEEEVLATVKGNNYFIKKALQELESSKKSGVLTKEREEYLLSAIDYAKRDIQHRLKGKDFYKLYVRLIDNPKNKQLKSEVQQLKQEIKSFDPDKPIIMSRISKSQRYLIMPTLFNNLASDYQSNK